MDNSKLGIFLHGYFDGFNIEPVTNRQTGEITKRNRLAVRIPNLKSGSETYKITIPDSLVPRFENAKLDDIVSLSVTPAVFNPKDGKGILYFQVNI